MVSIFLLPVPISVPVPRLSVSPSASTVFVAMLGLSAYFLIFYDGYKLLRMT